MYMILLYFVVGASLVWAASWLVLCLVKRGLSPRQDYLTIRIENHIFSEGVDLSEFVEGCDDSPAELPLDGAMLETLAEIRELPEV